MTSLGYAARQRRFYDTRRHEHLQAGEGDTYAHNLAERLARGAGIEKHHRVLEVGAGFGRFTFELLAFCDSITALDLSPVALATLERTRDGRGIPPDRCRVHCADADAVTPGALGGEFDFVVGFFLLHHLEDMARTLGVLRIALAAGGRMAFVEPNRRNPLFLAQVACCRDMGWREEKGLFRLTARGVSAVFREVGLRPLPGESFGFFPPQIVNFAPGFALEKRLERIGLLKPILPLLLLSAEAPQPDAVAP
jgi:SAM-dependent methyltransferase